MISGRLPNEITAKTPNLCHLAPAGPTYMEDLNQAGGVYAVMNELTKKGLIKSRLSDSNNGTTVGENIANCVNKNPGVYPSGGKSVSPPDRRYSRYSQGDMAPGRRRGRTKRCPRTGDDGTRGPGQSVRL